MVPVALSVADSSQVSSTRSALQRMARDLEFSEVQAGKVAIVVTEAATNMLRHAGGGLIAARCLADEGMLGIELLAIDSGPGIESFHESARDGFSTAGSAGTGLGAMQRLADEFDVYSVPGSGTVVRMALWKDGGPAPGDYEFGAVCTAKAGEKESGDAWALQLHPDGMTLLVADGLGHGPEASRAAYTAVDVLRRHPEQTPLRLLDLAHGALRPTRGAAVAVAGHRSGESELTYAGVGNIAACVIDRDKKRAMVSHNGIVGQNVHKSQEYRYPWPVNALLIAHSDGLETHWDLSPHPGLATAHASIIAAVLAREHSRKRDDLVVVVARRRR